MLIGIWGHSAVGKTTWLKSIMDELPEINPNLVVVLGDLAEEYHYDLERDVWVLVENKLRWQGKREEKLMWPVSDLIGGEKIWVLESMRWFNGLQPLLTSQYTEFNRQGLAMIIPYAQPEVHQAFLQQRCDSRNKQMSPWWTPDNCWKEALYRLNSVDKHWKPAGVPHYVFEIDAERRQWANVTDIIKLLLRKGV